MFVVLGCWTDETRNARRRPRPWPKSAKKVPPPRIPPVASHHCCGCCGEAAAAASCAVAPMLMPSPRRGAVRATERRRAGALRARGAASLPPPFFLDTPRRRCATAALMLPLQAVCTACGALQRSRSVPFVICVACSTPPGDDVMQRLRLKLHPKEALRRTHRTHGVPMEVAAPIRR
jgi:hypothetical protein